MAIGANIAVAANAVGKVAMRANYRKTMIRHRVC